MTLLKKKKIDKNYEIIVKYKPGLKIIKILRKANSVGVKFSSEISLLRRNIFLKKRKISFATNSNFLIPISLQPDGVKTCDYLIYQNSYFEI